MKEIIEKVLGSVKQLNPLMYVASGAEDFMKVLAEYKYDALAKTAYFQKLKDLEIKNKLVLVAFMFALNAHLKIKLTENTPWNLFLKGMLTDFFPEMGKRIINGDTSPSPDPDEQAVIELIRQTDNNGQAHYAPRDKPKKSGPGFFVGTPDLFRKKMQDYIDGKGGKNNV